MGQSQSGACSLAVKTKHVQYTAGEQVTGTVYVYVKSTMQATGVVMKVKGAEKTFFTQRRTTRGEDDQRDEREFQDEIKFFNIEMPLLRPPMGQLKSGQLEIPFSFYLPSSTPPSFQEESGREGSDTYRCSVDYEIEVFIEVPRALFSHKATHKQPLAVLSRPVVADKVTERIQRTRKVCLCCCIPRGEVWMRAQLDRNAYAPGSTAKITLELNNTSRSKIQRIVLRLDRHLRLGTRGTGLVFNKYDCIAIIKEAGLKAGEACTEQAGRHVDITLPSNELNLLMQPEYHGQLLDCSYTLSILAKVECTPALTLDLPIHIHHSINVPPSPAYAAPALPQATAIDWQPTIVQSVDLPPPSAPEASLGRLGACNDSLPGQSDGRVEQYRPPAQVPIYGGAEYRNTEL